MHLTHTSTDQRYYIVVDEKDRKIKFGKTAYTMSRLNSPDVSGSHTAQPSSSAHAGDSRLRSDSPPDQPAKKKPTGTGS